MSLINCKNWQNYLISEPYQDKGWTPRNLLSIKLPIIYLRDKTGRWEKDDCLQKAVIYSVEELKSWQAFRTPDKGRAIQIEKKVVEELPNIIIDIQNKIEELVKPQELPIIVDDIIQYNRYERKTYDRILITMVEAVYNVSLLKENKQNNPMFGSKFLHFFFPELFPVWDNAEIGVALHEICDEDLKEWYVNRLNDKIYSRFGSEWACYGYYLAAMFKDVYENPDTISCLQSAYINDSRIPEGMVAAAIKDLSPFIMEACTIGTMYE